MQDAAYGCNVLVISILFSSKGHVTFVTTLSCHMSQTNLIDCYDYLDVMLDL